ncbi:MAG: nickel pincer cofactor biosynthesis protein LarC [Pyrinomonadaceae bacterium]
MKTLYFDCFAGASGNMILGGLFSLGIGREQLLAELRSMDLPPFDLAIEQVVRSGINAVHVETVYETPKNYRHLPDILGIIEQSTLSQKVKSNAGAVFGRLAEAEAKVHGVPVEKIHFHEVGALDAIIDIVGACIGFEFLEIDAFECSPINVGNGFIEIDHGRFPVPPPAVSELAKGFETYRSELNTELLTPTGAAIITTFCSGTESEYRSIAERVGYGAGTKEFERFPNVLRLEVGSAERNSNVQPPLLLLEANVDDSSGEALGHFLETAFEYGAVDCWFTAIQMKKNRPGTMISVLCRATDKEKFLGLIYNETSTIGVRIRELERDCLDRETREVETKFGLVSVKVSRFCGKVVAAKPEYEDLRRIAGEKEMSFSEVSRIVGRECLKLLEGE